MREGFKDLPGGTSDGQITGGNGAGDNLPEQMAQKIWQTMPNLESGGNTALDFGSHGTVTLTGVALKKLAADNFMFG